MSRTDYMLWLLRQQAHLKIPVLQQMLEKVEDASDATSQGRKICFAGFDPGASRCPFSVSVLRFLQTVGKRPNFFRTLHRSIVQLASIFLSLLIRWSRRPSDAHRPLAA